MTLCFRTKIDKNGNGKEINIYTETKEYNEIYYPAFMIPRMDYIIVSKSDIVRIRTRIINDGYTEAEDG